MRQVSFVVLLALAVAACGGGDPVVAEVNGREIRESQVLELREQVGASVPAADFRNDLSRLILGEVIRSALDDQFGVRVSQADVDAELQAQLASAGLDLDAAVAALQEPGATEEMLRSNIEILLLRDGAYEALAARADYLRELYEEAPDAFAQVCAAHILVESQGEAEDVVGLLADGEDFAALAEELSLDSAPGGDLGCRSPGAYVGEFADATMVAPLGEPFGPVQTQFGYHVIVVSERTSPSLAEVEADPLTFLPADVIRNEWTLWINDQVTAADISVRSNIGTWSEAGQGIEPPG